jgi:hypothetical protein
VGVLPVIDCLDDFNWFAQGVWIMGISLEHFQDVRCAVIEQGWALEHDMLNNEIHSFFMQSCVEITMIGKMHLLVPFWVQERWWIDPITLKNMQM